MLTVAEPLFHTRFVDWGNKEFDMVNTEFKVGDLVNEFCAYHKTWSTVEFEIIKITKTGRYALAYRKADGTLRKEGRAVKSNILRKAA